MSRGSPPARWRKAPAGALLFALLFLAGRSEGSRLPIPPDAWVSAENLKPAYYLSVDNEYPNLGGVIHRAVLFDDRSFDPKKGVFAYDREDGWIPFTVSGAFDPRKPGVYHLKYSATDSAGQTTTFTRTLVVLPPGKIALFDVSGRFGPRDVRPLGDDRRNRLSEDVTFIVVDVTAPPGARYAYREIRRPWPAGAQGAADTRPPADADWAAAQEKPFYRDLHIFRDVRVDRWLQIRVSVGERSVTRVYGLKGDPGETFVSPADGKRYWRLSAPVDDPMTAAEQHKYFCQGDNYGYNWPIALQKRMGAYARQITARRPGASAPGEAENELHGRPVFSRFYTPAYARLPEKPKTQEAWWRMAQIGWLHALGIEKNRSYLRSYQIPITELTRDDLPARPIGRYLAHLEALYYRLRREHPYRVFAVTPSGIGGFSMFDHFRYTSLDGKPRVGFPDKKGPYFKVEFHGFNMDRKFVKFAPMPFLGVYSKVKLKHINTHEAPAAYYPQLRKWLRLAKQYGDKVEICVQEQFLIIRRNDDGSFAYYALPYVALRHGYIGSHYLNNQPYFVDDCDGDSLPNALERKLGSNPFNADTDGDGIFDLDEYRWGLDIRRNDAKEDADADHLDNLTEALYSKPLGWKIKTKTLYIPEVDANGNMKLGRDGRPIMTTPRADRPDGLWDPERDGLPVWFEFFEKLNTDKAWREGEPCLEADQLEDGPDRAQSTRMMRYLAGAHLPARDRAGLPPDTRRREWARWGETLFVKHFQPDRLRPAVGRVVRRFFYSPTERGIVAAMSFRDVRASGENAAALRLEALLDRSLRLLEDLRSRPDLWRDQPNVILSLSETFAPPAPAACRGVYLMSIPAAVFRREAFRPTAARAIQQLLAAPPTFRTVRADTGAPIRRTWRVTASGIRLLFMEQGAAPSSPPKHPHKKSRKRKGKKSARRRKKPRR